MFKLIEIYCETCSGFFFCVAMASGQFFALVMLSIAAITSNSKENLTWMMTPKSKVYSHSKNIFHYAYSVFRTIQELMTFLGVSGSRRGVLLGAWTGGRTGEVVCRSGTALC